MVEPYLDLLRAGGSRSPEELARIVGLDLTDPSIWASGLDALGRGPRRGRAARGRARPVARLTRGSAGRLSVGNAGRGVTLAASTRHTSQEGASYEESRALGRGARRALGVTASSATSAASRRASPTGRSRSAGRSRSPGRRRSTRSIPPSMKAYFSYINSRKGPDGKRGVFGRQIDFKYYDDGYNPANSVQLTRKLVEEDKVFAIVGSLGTEPNLAIRPVPQRAQGAADARRDGRNGLGRATRRSTRGRAAGSPTTQLRGPDLRPGDRPQQPERQDRRALPERQLRRRLPAGSQRGPRRQDLEHRREGAVRGDGRGRPRTGREAPRLRGERLRDLRDAEVHDPGVRDRERAQVVAARDLHELRLRDGHVPDAREELGRRRPAEQDLHRPVREGPGQPALGQRRGDEALQAGDGEVPRPARTRHRRAQLLRRRRRRGVRRADVQGGEEPDPRLADEGVSAAGTSSTRSCSRATGRRRGQRPVPAPVRADRQVHGRDVRARLEAQVRRRRHRPTASRWAGTRRPRPPAPAAPSTPPSA